MTGNTENYLQMLRIIRIQKGITEEEAGRIIGKSKEIYSKKEEGQIEFTLQEIITLTKALNISINALLRKTI